MAFDIRLKTNFKLFLSGPSGSGKTTFIVNLIKNLKDIAKDPPKIIIYFFKEWQPKFNDLAERLNIHFLEDSDKIIEHVSQLSSSALVIFDDMMNSQNLKTVAQLFTVHGRHLDLSLAFLSQRLFKNDEFFRQISQNSDYMIIFKNPRNTREIRTLAGQITSRSLELVNIYHHATRYPYSYLFINLTQEVIPQLQYLTKLFSTSGVVNVYVISNCQ